MPECTSIWEDQVFYLIKTSWILQPIIVGLVSMLVFEPSKLDSSKKKKNPDNGYLKLLCDSY